jgi:hypothetical protein
MKSYRFPFGKFVAALLIAGLIVGGLLLLPSLIAVMGLSWNEKPLDFDDLTDGRVVLATLAGGTFAYLAAKGFEAVNSTSRKLGLARITANEVSSILMIYGFLAIFHGLFGHDLGAAIGGIVMLGLGLFIAGF